VFYREDDYARFMEQVIEAQGKDDVRLYAYCLMPNHYHLFLETPRGNIDRFMDRLGTAYAMYFRYKHFRPGHCFQGRYKSPLVHGDEYAVRLTRYIHLNPVCVKATRDWDTERKMEYLVRYRWSSLRGYLRAREAEEHVDYRWLGLFGSRARGSERRGYSRYIKRQIGHEDDVLRDAFRRSSYAIGDSEFVARVEEWVRSQAKSLDVPGDVAVPRCTPSLQKIEQAVAAEYGLSSEDLRRRHRKGRGEARAVFIELACSVGEATQRSVAAHLGTVSEHAVGKSRKDLARMLKDDPQLRARFEGLKSSF
jgi:REP element-mobilizing transposase RayT